MPLEFLVISLIEVYISLFCSSEGYSVNNLHMLNKNNFLFFLFLRNTATIISVTLFTIFKTYVLTVDCPQRAVNLHLFCINFPLISYTASSRNCNQGDCASYAGNKHIHADVMLFNETYLIT